jgi:hypothetical protein
MNQFEFVKFEATPGEKHLGIATVKAFEGKITLRYKIVPNKDGSGFFPASASYKMPQVGGEDVYIGSFLLDSRSDEEEMNALIRANVKKHLSHAPSASVHAPDSFSAPVNEEIPF